MYYIALVARDYNIAISPRSGAPGGTAAAFTSRLETCNGPFTAVDCDITIDFNWDAGGAGSGTGQVTIFSGSSSASTIPAPGNPLIYIEITNLTHSCTSYSSVFACPFPTTTTSTTTTTTTTIPTIPCNGAASYTGGTNYPSEAVINLGSTTGTVSLSFDASAIPDLFLLQWNSTNVINSGYRGASYFDFGGARRAEFKASLLGKVDPIYSTTYPDITNYTDDGYPRVTSPGYGVLSFNKNLSSPTTCTLKVYGPMTSTAWTATVSCPV